MSAVKSLIMIIVIILLLLFGIKQQVEINALNDEIEKLESVLEAEKESNEELENMTNKSDDELMAELAEESGFVDPQKEIFYGA